MNKQITPYGLWSSPITPQVLASKSTRYGQIQFINDAIYWLESRPHEQGRGVIVRSQNEEREDITPEGFNVRTRVHEYAGGDFWGRGEWLLFADDTDQRLCLQNLVTNSVEFITPEPPVKRSLRYCDGEVAPNMAYTVCVHERHEADEVINELIVISVTAPYTKQVIAQGYDFYSSPRISPDGKQLCWISWNHPNMPWDETELWLADISESGVVSNQRKVAGGDNVSVYHPFWSVDNKLYYVADSDGWWHIYSLEHPSEPVHQLLEIEFGLPQWVFGCRTVQWLDDKKLIAIGTKQGQQALYQINLENGDIELCSGQWTAFNGQMVSDGDELYFMAANPQTGEAVYQFNFQSRKALQLTEIEGDQLADYISVPRHIEFPTTGDQKAFGYFYPPKNPEYQGSTNEKPPLIVMSHGGPTGMTDNGLNLTIQYWTSRGFAVADVNYRGSTGYGRAYRDSLKGQWGILDVDDCIAMGQHLAQEGVIDGSRMAIRGGSAGGYTTLCALTFHDVFKVGMSRYGVAELVSLSQDSHKFEIRYLDSVVGPYPECAELYHQRSPVNHTELLSCPILILQGLEDKVVPPNQAEAMVKALKEKGLPYEYITFEGEGHGFRKPETIIKAFTAELAFYRKYLL
ncbi:S9 family peptidase [Kangiella koreensis]|uniref:Peptidase S9 prolyl oligopeptidase active site domain protein n=1 Tax=Kangiella koreensis (strain DSM 16069 / JCM 12317 / KCTC 12182 / SW-125) TaxID=523791 RepID=C7RA81_KANKD|nr:S9 family peptidase [Kangiella koreensis]ACV26200.1 peptidase S9 prolyl oligopeptidase active site domain protein [Kangiella koreensis DSM 16069]